MCKAELPSVILLGEKTMLTEIDYLHLFCTATGQEATIAIAVKDGYRLAKIDGPPE
jgi:hypothetical protein